ncbi:hypothetical protein MKX01_005595 [Papaver californicum]|nr:hypothetical protein MKX01_005595 [Papaver californicum]
MSSPISSSSYSSTLYSRKLLLLRAIPHLSADSPIPSHPGRHSNTHQSNFDTNVVMVLSILLCALICALGLNSIIRCFLSCSNRVAHDSGDTPPVQSANTGIKEKALKTFPVVTYLSGLKLQGLDTECVICLSELAQGERVRILPKCNHGFHIKCIDKWLSSHSSCPTCRHCLIETCEKIINGGNQPRSLIPQAPAPPPPSSRVVLSEHEGIIPTPSPIVPSEREGMTRNVADIC